MKKLLISNGGSTVPSVTAKCTHLVCDSIGSAKSEKAIKNGMQQLTNINNNKPTYINVKRRFLLC
jgi:hypothetical protein